MRVPTAVFYRVGGAVCAVYVVVWVALLGGVASRSATLVAGATPRGALRDGMLAVGVWALGCVAANLLVIAGKAITAGSSVAVAHELARALEPARDADADDGGGDAAGSGGGGGDAAAAAEVEVEVGAAQGAALEAAHDLTPPVTQYEGGLRSRRRGGGGGAGHAVGAVLDAVDAAAGADVTRWDAMEEDSAAKWRGRTLFLRRGAPAPPYGRRGSAGGAPALAPALQTPVQASVGAAAVLSSGAPPAALPRAAPSPMLAAATAPLSAAEVSLGGGVGGGTARSTKLRRDGGGGSTASARGGTLRLPAGSRTPDAPPPIVITAGAAGSSSGGGGGGGGMVAGDTQALTGRVVSTASDEPLRLLQQRTMDMVGFFMARRQRLQVAIMLGTAMAVGVAMDNLTIVAGGASLVSRDGSGDAAGGFWPVQVVTSWATQAMTGLYAVLVVDLPLRSMLGMQGIMAVVLVMRGVGDAAAHLGWAPGVTTATGVVTAVAAAVTLTMMAANLLLVVRSLRGHGASALHTTSASLVPGIVGWTGSVAYVAVTVAEAWGALRGEQLAAALLALDAIHAATATLLLLWVQVDESQFRTFQLQAAAAAVLTAATSKRQLLLRYVSHHLRIPVQAMQAALEDSADSADPAVARLHAAVHANVGAILHTLDDLANMDGWLSGAIKLYRQPVACRALSDHVHDALTRRLSPRNLRRVTLRVAPDTPATVVADETRVVHVIVDLVTNGLVYSPPSAGVTVEVGRLTLPAAPTPLHHHTAAVAPAVGSAPTAASAASAPTTPPALTAVAAAAAEALLLVAAAAPASPRAAIRAAVAAVHSGDGAPWLLVQVHDRGAGISEEDRAKLFQPFHRLVSGGKATGTTGLSLVIARHVVEHHGGRVGALPRTPCGTTFWLALPASDTPVGVAAPAPAPVASGGSTPVEGTRRGAVSLLPSVAAPRPAGMLASLVGVDANAAGGASPTALALQPRPAGAAASRPRHDADVTAGGAPPPPPPVTVGTATTLEVAAALAMPTLPLSLVAAAAATSGATDAGAAAALPPPPPGCAWLTHAVVVDDVTTNLRTLVRQLTRHGVTVVGTAADGREARALYDADAACRAAVWFIDKNMPVMDGADLIRSLRRAGFSGAAVGVTGDTVVSDLQAFLAAGLTSVVTKPCTTDKLDAALRASALALPPAVSPASIFSSSGVASMDDAGVYVYTGGGGGVLLADNAATAADSHSDSAP